MKKDQAQKDPRQQETEGNRSGEYGFGYSGSHDVGEEGLHEDEISSELGSALGQAEISRSSYKSEAQKREDRLSAEKDNYDPSSHSCLTMSQLVSMLRSKEGLIIYDVAGSAHSVSLQKDVHNKTLNTEVVLLSGPVGKRDKGQCGVKERCPNIFPQSRVQYIDFIREQTQLLQRISNVALAKQDYSAYQTINENLATLVRFNEQFSRRVELVMGGIGMIKSHHVTRWAV